MADALGFLGLAARAGKVATGEEACMRAVQTGKARVVIVAEDAGANAMKKILDKCGTFGVPVRILYSRVELGRAVGKATRVVVAVTDTGFAKGVLERMD